MSRIAVIPARGGSTRIPRKNIRLFHGFPMIRYSIETAKASGLFDRIIVSTDDREIAETAVHYGATDINERRPEHARNEVGTQEVARQVILDYQGFYNPQYVCVIYATAPLMLADDLKLGLVRLVSTGMDYVYTVGAQPDGTLTDAGQWYFGKTKSFIDGVPLFENGYGFVIPPERVCDINVEADWQRAERMWIEICTSQHRWE